MHRVVCVVHSDGSNLKAINSFVSSFAMVLSPLRSLVKMHILNGPLQGPRIDFLK